MYIGSNFTFKNNGSNKAIIMGKVYKDKTPKATFDSFKA